MSDLGQFALEQQNNGFLGYDGGGRSEYSDEVAYNIDIQIRSIILECYDRAKNIIGENRTTVDRLVEILIDRETIEGDDFRKIVSESTREIKDSLAIS